MLRLQEVYDGGVGKVTEARSQWAGRRAVSEMTTSDRQLSWEHTNESMRGHGAIRGLHAECIL